MHKTDWSSSVKPTKIEALHPTAFAANDASRILIFSQLKIIFLTILLKITLSMNNINAGIIANLSRHAQIIAETVQKHKQAYE